MLYRLCVGVCLMVGVWLSNDCCPSASVLLIVKWNCYVCLTNTAMLFATTAWYDNLLTT